MTQVRMSFKATSVLLLLFLFIITGQSQTVDLECSILSEQIAGSRAAAMGGAFTALSDDATATAWNPAGLSQCKRVQFIASGSINFTNISVTLPTTLSSQTYRINSQGTFDAHYVGITLPIIRNRPGIVVGVALQNLVPLQDRTSIILKDTGVGWTDKREMRRDGTLYALNGGMSLSVLPEISFGIVVASLFGRQQTDSTTLFTFDTFERSGHYRQKNDFSGHLVRMGILWHLQPQFSLGSSVTMPHRINLERRKFGDPIAESMTDSADVALSKPLRLSIGACWRLSADFLITFDYHFQPWRQAYLTRSGISVYNDFADAHSFHMGSEFSYDASYYTFSWRLGFYTQPEQLFEEQNGRRGAQISSHFYTTGIGVQTGIFALDLSLLYQNLQYKAPTLVEHAVLADISEHNYYVRFSMQFFY